MNYTSIEPMDSRLEILKNIKQVAAPANLYDDVLRKIAAQKTKVIPMFWVKVAAAVILLILVADIAVLKEKGTSSNATASLIEVENYQLYYE